MNNQTQTIALAVTGASGIQYPMRLLECLLRADRHIYLMFSRAAQVVAGIEADWNLPACPAEMREFLLNIEQTPAPRWGIDSR